MPSVSTAPKTIFRLPAIVSAAAVQYSSYALMMLVRLDPLDADTLDSLRAQALSDMKSGELQDSLQSYGAQLPHALDSAAMKKMPASKIKNEQ